MKRTFMKSLAAAMATWLLTATGLLTTADASAADHRDDEAAIRKAAEAYTIAFDKRDAKALAALWSPNAVYSSPIGGKQVEGRPAIEAEFAGMFKQAGEARLSVKIASIRFITDNVATEDGTAQVVRPGEPPSESTYTAIHVKKEGKWLIDSVRETVLPEPPTAAEHLKDLDWMVGQWGDADSGVREDCLRVDGEPRISDSVIRCHDAGRRAFPGNAGDRLGSVQETVSFLGLRLRRRICRGRLEARRRPLDHPVDQRPARRPKRRGHQRPA